MRQIEVSRTLVFTQPRHARAFFEALVADGGTGLVVGLRCVDGRPHGWLVRVLGRDRVRDG